VVGGGRSWRVLATRSERLVPYLDLVRACAEADIAVSERRLPPGCKPRWLKADRLLLRKSGGLAFVFGESASVQTVADTQGRHPWALAAAGEGR
jgi:competence protein ComEC